MNVEDPKKLKPGEARCDGAPTVQEILDRDQEVAPIPDALRSEKAVFMGSEDLDPRRWYSQEFHDLEMQKVWSKVWQMACREEEIPEAGDHIRYDIGDWSFLVVRQTDLSIKAFYNACLHRGRMLREEDGHLQQFRCPYHGFTWELDGALKEVPCRWDFPHVTDEKFALPEVRVGTWGGFVFINMDDDCESLEDFLGDVPDHFRQWALEDNYKAAHVGKRVDMNWKVGLEAFIESYHVIATHPQIMPSTGDANTQYDVDPRDNFNRMITPMAVTSPHMEELKAQEIVDSMTPRSYRYGLDPATFKVPDGMTARRFMGNLRRDALKADVGKDYSHATDSEMLDAIQYWVFPNFFPWGGYGSNIIYRFRPDGNNPNSAFMEVMLLRSYDKSKPKPDPVPMRVLGEDEEWIEAEDVLGGLAPVFQQDMSNMPLVQKGLKTLALKKGVTLANYEESRVRHLHVKLDEYINRK